jgi:hypothetical protein
MAGQAQRAYGRWSIFWSSHKLLKPQLFSLQGLSMKTPIVFLAFLMLNTAAQAEPAPDVPVVKMLSAESSASLELHKNQGCDVNFIEKYSRFLRFDNSKDQKTYLIRQDAKLGRGCFEGYMPQTATLSAWEINTKTGALAAKPAWSFTDTEAAEMAHTPNLSEALYRTIAPGCCASTPVAKYYSLYSGTLLFFSTPDPINIRKPDDSRLFIGAAANTAAVQLPGTNAIAKVYLSNDERILQTLSVHSKKWSEVEWDVVSLLPKNSHFPYLDQSEISSNPSSLVLELACRCELTTPVKIEFTLPMGASKLAVTKVSNPDIVVKQ